MAEGAEMNNTVAQRILYFGLPNQCQKCRRFGHHARVCNVIKIKPWEEAAHPNTPPLSKKEDKRPCTRAPQQKPNQAGRRSHPQSAKNNPTPMGRGSTRAETWHQTNCPRAPAQANSLAKSHSEETARSLSHKEALRNAKANQDMAEPTNSPGLSQDRLNSEDKRHSEGAFTPKAKFNFGIQELASPQAPNPASNANPFAVLGEGNPGAEVVKKIH